MFNGIVIIRLIRLLVVVRFLVSNVAVLHKPMSTAFECGFDTFRNARVPFSLSFFLLAIIFLIFDVEIAIIFPISLSCFYSVGILRFLRFFIFLLVLLAGLFYEWSEGSLDWIRV